MKLTLRSLSLVLAGALLVTATAAAPSHVAAQNAAPAAPPAAQNAPSTGLPGASANNGNELVKALKESPGCIGVEVAQTPSRKQAIFAWFKDKKAVLDWYYGDFHQTAMMGIKEAAEAQGHADYETARQHGDANAEERTEPLQWVADDCGPVMCIATITPTTPDKSVVPGFPLPISQISIELYAPLPGGIAFNGKFAPAALKVPHLLEMAAPPKSAAPAAPPSSGK